MALVMASLASFVAWSSVFAPVRYAVSASLSGFWPASTAAHFGVTGVTLPLGEEAARALPTALVASLAVSFEVPGTAPPSATMSWYFLDDSSARYFLAASVFLLDAGMARFEPPRNTGADEPAFFDGIGNAEVLSARSAFA